MKKHSLGLMVLIASVTTVGIAVAQTKPADTLLVCRSRQCADASYSMTRGFLFNKITQLFNNNRGRTVLICEADPISHACLSEGIQVPAQAAFTQTHISINSLKLHDIKIIPNSDDLAVAWDYQIQAGGTYPQCELGVSGVSVSTVNKVEMTTQDFACNLTQTGNTSVNASYSVDYLDFDYGFIGAYYTIGIGEAVTGEKTGYALFRFTNREPLTMETVDETETDTMITATTTAAAESASQASEPAPITLKSDPAIVTETVAVMPDLEPLPTTVRKTTVTETTIITPDTTQPIAQPPEARTRVPTLEQ